MLSGASQHTIPILLVDDHPVVRMGYAALLRRYDSGYVFHEAATREEALMLLDAQTPKLALADLNLTDGVELAIVRDLRRKAPRMPILVVSMHDELLYAERALRAGAQGYLMKQDAAQSIAKAVQAVLAGRGWLSCRMRDKLGLAHIAPHLTKMKKLNQLSDRDLELFRLLGTGLKKTEIATRLGLSDTMVEHLRDDLKQRLGVATNAELYRMAFLQFRHDGMSHG